MRKQTTSSEKIREFISPKTFQKLIIASSRLRIRYLNLTHLSTTEVQIYTIFHAYVWTVTVLIVLICEHTGAVTVEVVT